MAGFAAFSGQIPQALSRPKSVQALYRGSVSHRPGSNANGLTSAPNIGLFVITPTINDTVPIKFMLLCGYKKNLYVDAEFYQGGAYDFNRYFTVIKDC